MNHKRRRPKNRRAGCLLCKPHKANGVHAPTMQELRAPTVPDLSEVESVDVCEGDCDWCLAQLVEERSVEPEQVFGFAPRSLGTLGDLFRRAA